MIRKITICLSLVAIGILLGCSLDDDEAGGHPMPWLYGITEDQKQLHWEFKSIINDSGPLGDIDSFIVDSIYCIYDSTAQCNEIDIDYFDVRFTINKGDLFDLSEGRIRIIDIPAIGNNYHDIGLFQNSPEDFKYIEFGIMDNGTMVNCCFYSRLYHLDKDEKIIEFSYPFDPFKNYNIRLTGID